MGCKRLSLFLHIITGVVLLSTVADSNINPHKLEAFKILDQPSIRVVGKTAKFEFRFTGLVTRIKVNNCVKGTAKCHTDYVNVRPDGKSKQLLDVHTVRGEVILVDPKAQTLTFSFWGYLRDKLVNHQPFTVDVNINYPFHLEGPSAIRVVGKKAEVQFRHKGPLTRINVTNCVKGTTSCLSETLLVIPDEEDEHLYKGEVYLVDSTAKTLTFYFWCYLGDTLINSRPYIVDVNTAPDDSRIVIIILVAAFISVIVVAICLASALCCCGSYWKGKSKEKVVLMERPVVVNDSFVMHTELNTHKGWNRTHEPIKEPPVKGLKLTFNHNAPPGVTLRSMLSDGNFYDVWIGDLVDERKTHHDVAIKAEKGHNDVLINYLIKQGQAMARLKNNPYIIGCLGTSQDHKFLFMELSTKGNLKQYLLRARAKTPSANMSVPPSFANSFIHQIIEGVHAVHSIDPPCLFYCLSASHVLLSADERCKLSGFAESSAVTLREEFEEKHNLPRPVQWLSPEAIRLQHTNKSDIWSFGILMWEIFSEGRDPFDEFNSEEARYLVLNGQKLLKPIKCSDKMYDVMLRCWMYEPNNRPSLPEINQSFLTAQ